MKERKLGHKTQFKLNCEQKQYFITLERTEGKTNYEKGKIPSQRNSIDILIAWVPVLWLCVCGIWKRKFIKYHDDAFFTVLTSVQMLTYNVVASCVKTITTLKQPPARHFRDFPTKRTTKLFTHICGAQTIQFRIIIVVDALSCNCF